MKNRILIIILSVLLLTVLGTHAAVAQIQACQSYDKYFEEASETYQIPSALLKAIALHESGCNQAAENEADGGCGIMQLTADTRTAAAALLGVLESTLCDKTLESSARLNILGGAAVLDSRKCWANPRVVGEDDFNACSVGQHGYSFKPFERLLLSETLEPWWWPLVSYNGAGADGFLFTSNYPFRVWGRFDEVVSGINISYPPIGDIQYRLNGEQAPNDVTVRYDPAKEIQSDDILLYPTPGELGRPGITGGIRWMNPNFNAFDEVALHRNDGSESCHMFDSNDPIFSGYGAPYNLVSEDKELLLRAFCAPGATSLIIGSGNESGPEANYEGLMYVYAYVYVYEPVINQTSNQGPWQLIPLKCAGDDKTKYADLWCKGKATGNLSAATNEWFVAYTCEWSGSHARYFCGCADSSCSGGHWQLQRIGR